jgi:uncharacterized membrane protein YfcA
MLALTLDQARNLALAAIALLVVGAVASAWLMQTLVQKVVLFVILGLLAVLVWSRRSALDDCADRVLADIEQGDLSGDTTCVFFGRQVEIDTSPS